MNRLNLQRIVLPDARIRTALPVDRFHQRRRRDWTALTGGAKGTYSPLIQMRLFAGSDRGRGKSEQRRPFTSCDYTRTSCVAARDVQTSIARAHTTARFGGIEFVPAQILVRGYGESGTHLSL